MRLCSELKKKWHSNSCPFKVPLLIPEWSLDVLVGLSRFKYDFCFLFMMCCILRAYNTSEMDLTGINLCTPPHGSLQLERKRVHTGCAHRRWLHAIHRRAGRPQERVAAASLRASEDVVRRRRPHDVSWLWRARGRNRESSTRIEFVF